MTTTKSWEGFCGSNFIKVDDVEGEEDAFVVVSIEIYGDQGSSKPRLSLEKNKGKFTFDLNVTNSNFCKNNGIKTPQDLIGKKLYFKKIFVQSPKTKKEVESLRILKIE